MPRISTPVAGTLVAVIEIWQILTLAGDRWLALLLGTIGGRNVKDPVYGQSRLAFLDGSASKLLLAKVVLTLLNRLPQRPKFLASKVGCYSLPKSLRFAPMWG